MKYRSARGTRDIISKEASLFGECEKIARSLFLGYGYEEIRTPVFESAGLFMHSIGETSDIVSKEMFAFTDSGGRELALRPEGTAGVVRAFIEHNLDRQGGTKKFFYTGPMFRSERPQAGRYREFWQIGAEYFGNPSVGADAEIILLTSDIFSKIGLKDLNIQINSVGCASCRKEYRKVLVSYLSKMKGSLCEDCNTRVDKNPMRVFDCKRDSSKLSEAPHILDNLCEICSGKFEDLKELLGENGVSFIVNPGLVRGLDYYTGNVFEAVSASLGAQNAVAAGGRYDDLVKLLGGPDIPAAGFAMGLDRTISALDENRIKSITDNIPKRVFVAVIGGAARNEGLAVLRILRKGDICADGGYFGRSLKSQMRLADAWGASFVVIIGEDEIKKGIVQLKDLNKHTQEDIKRSDLADRLHDLMK